MIPPSPDLPTPRGGRPLDPERPAPDDLPPGLRAQIGATREALVGLARAHLDLAKAEASEIGAEVGRATLLGLVAFASAFMLVFLLTIGMLLFIGSAVFGSMGWGILHGTLLLIAVAASAILAAVRAPGARIAVPVALLAGSVVTLLAVFNGPNRVWTWVGELLNFQVGTSDRPLLTAALVFGVLGALVGLAAGARTVRSAGSRTWLLAGPLAGFVLGAVVGALTAISYSVQVAFALGVCAFLLAWPITWGALFAREGIDQEALKRRFTPQVTIDTTKETIEWAKARMPLGPQS